MDNIDFPILNDYIINSEPPRHIALSDPVLCFNNLNEWIIIELDIFLKTPIIWTKIYKDNSAIDASIVLCPRTLRASVFENKLKSVKYDKNDRLILTDDEKSLIPIDLNIAVDINAELEPSKRYQIYIQTLRNALVDYYDVKYLHPKKSHKYIINKNYLSNRLDEYDNEITREMTFHPKTLVHILQYTSSKSGNKKITILIGKDANNIDYKGYDNKKSGFDEYLMNFSDDIIKRDCFIMPILYYKALTIYPNAKIITLT
jgi:hypothetical protein